MYDIKPLEEEWERYRRKKRKPFFILLLTIIVLGAGGVFLYYMKERGLLVIDENATQKTKVGPINFLENKPISNLEVEQVPQRTQIPTDEITEDSSEIVENLPISEERQKRKRPKVKMNIVTTEMPTVKSQSFKEDKQHKKVHLTITESSGRNAFKEVAKRFKETQDPDDSLFLAKAYYNQGQYKKAAYWAFQTNNVNNSIEESVLIFAKAKMKLGKKHEAIRILSKYIKQTDSLEAKILLGQIRKGKL
ncbi:CDC27 family protein [Sulfurovum lithotrophicum]|uniref:CDC27 family protein n=1 Tax=Sulfurovum lithotrophicum TaxID=206403 RepID=UPI000695CE2F|nr:CDC27 family protein [Sulfurovum lithotrophicum]